MNANATATTVKQNNVQEKPDPISRELVDRYLMAALTGLLANPHVMQKHDKNIEKLKEDPFYRDDPDMDPEWRAMNYLVDLVGSLAVGAIEKKNELYWVFDCPPDPVAKMPSTTSGVSQDSIPIWKRELSEARETAEKLNTNALHALVETPAAVLMPIETRQVLERVRSLLGKVRPTDDRFTKDETDEELASVSEEVAKILGESGS